jgi:hypothetical protein
VVRLTRSLVSLTLAGENQIKGRGNGNENTTPDFLVGIGTGYDSNEERVSHESPLSAM